MAKQGLNGWKVWIALAITVITAAITWGMTLQKVLDNKEDIATIEVKCESIPAMEANIGHNHDLLLEQRADIKELLKRNEP